MIAGILLIVFGVLIAVFPDLLAWIVAFMFMFMGVMVLAAGWYNRRLARHYDNPFFEIFFRF